jgi:hypothetical protein
MHPARSRSRVSAARTALPPIAGRGDAALHAGARAGRDGFTRGRSQHLLTSSRRAEDLLGWHAGDPADSTRRSVSWHLAHPPADPDPDFGPDDAALAAAGA